MNPFILILLIPILSWISMKLFYWLCVFILAACNEPVDEIDRYVILQLAKKDKFWKNVAKVLKIDNKKEEV